MWSEFPSFCVSLTSHQRDYPVWITTISQNQFYINSLTKWNFSLYNILFTLLTMLFMSIFFFSFFALRSRMTLLLTPIINDRWYFKQASWIKGRNNLNRRGSIKIHLNACMMTSDRRTCINNLHIIYIWNAKQSWNLYFRETLV